MRNEMDDLFQERFEIRKSVLGVSSWKIHCHRADE